MIKKYNGQRNFKHGMTGTKFYIIWISMKQRCKFNKKYYRYISVCSRWSRFENFKADMYKGYREHCEQYGEKNTSLDRINNYGNYEQLNCRWVTYKEQSNNTSFNRRLTLNGITMTVAEWSNKLSVTPNTIHTRLYRGWSIKRTLTQPIDYTKSNINH